MRAFIAIEIPESIQTALGALSERLALSKAKVSWVEPDRIHLTLRFLGDVPERDLNRLGERLAFIYQGVEPFQLTVAGIGTFPNARKPSVVWAGCGPMDGGLLQVQKAAEEAARAIGLPPEEKPFRAHLTLARVREERQLGDLAERMAAEEHFDAGAFEVKGVALFSSQLTPNGPIYRRIREFTF